MALRLRALELRVATEAGDYRTRIDFTDGLFLIRADNTSGKSTCLQAVMFALGLEGMVSPSHAVPLPHAMTHVLTDDETGAELRVLESSVHLEIANDRQESLTVARWAVHPTIRPELVRTWAGPALSAPSARYGEQDLYVRRQGAAVNAAGFHRRLAAFLGWSLPHVPTYDGTEVPLYLEYLFPLFMVEQKHGWAGVLTQMPSYLRVREGSRRAVEFLLELDAHQLAATRRSIDSSLADVRRRWTEAASAFRQNAELQGATLTSVPEQPASSWPPPVAPGVRVADGDDWTALEDVLKSVRSNLNSLQQKGVRTSDEAADEISDELPRLEERLAAVLATGSELLRDREARDADLSAVSRRIEALQEDLVRNRDAKALQNLGSSLAPDLVAEVCPTCHQNVSGLLVTSMASDAHVHVMTIDENIEYIRAQLESFSQLREEARKSRNFTDQKLLGIRSAASRLRREIRAARRTLTAPHDAPSEADIAARLRMEEQLSQLTRLHDEFRALVAKLEELSSEWVYLQAQAARIKGVQQSDADKSKLGRLRDLLRDQLRAYDFRSLPVDEIDISSDKYAPSHQGFDLGFDLSASDMIRTIWAYLLGLLELNRETRTMHPGLLVFDEPQQQAAKQLSFRQLLRRAADSSTFGQQIVVATSTAESEIAAMLTGTPYTIRAFSGKILSRIG